MNGRFMRATNISLGFKFVTGYILLFLIAVLIVIYPKDSHGLSWLYIMALTFPWSYLEALILMSLNLSSAISETVKLLSLVFFASINAFILYYLVQRSAQSNSWKTIKEGTQFLKEPENEDRAVILPHGVKGKIIGAKFYRGIKFNKMKLQDGRTGYVNDKHIIKPVNSNEK